jgi:hypothetical protein
MSTLAMFAQHNDRHLQYISFQNVVGVALYLYKFLPHLKVIQCYKQQNSVFFLSFVIKLNSMSSGNRMEIKWLQHVVRMLGVEKLVGKF